MLRLGLLCLSDLERVWLLSASCIPHKRACGFEKALRIRRVCWERDGRAAEAGILEFESQSILAAFEGTSMYRGVEQTILPFIPEHSTTARQELQLLHLVTVRLRQFDRAWNLADAAGLDMLLGPCQCRVRCRVRCRSGGSHLPSF